MDKNSHSTLPYKDIQTNLNKKYLVSLKGNLNTADNTFTLLIKSLMMLLMHSCDTWLPIIWPRCCSLDTELIIWLLNNTQVSQSLAFEKKTMSLLLLELKFTWNSSENCLHKSNKTHNEYVTNIAWDDPARDCSSLSSKLLIYTPNRIRDKTSSCFTPLLIENVSEKDEPYLKVYYRVKCLYSIILLKL